MTAMQGFATKSVVSEKLFCVCSLSHQEAAYPGRYRQQTPYDVIVIIMMYAAIVVTVAV
jgi:hypothetical protein